MEHTLFSQLGKSAIYNAERHNTLKSRKVAIAGYAHERPNIPNRNFPSLQTDENSIRFRFHGIVTFYFGATQNAQLRQQQKTLTGT